MKVNEIFYSVQGEGRNTGKPMAFVRLSGCNLSCGFCDTKYALNSGEDLPVSQIISQVKEYKSKRVCITGGEPFLQDLNPLISVLRKENYKIQIETNGTIFQPVECDWLVVSPKVQKKPDVSMLKRADEIKMVVDSEQALEKISEFEKWGEYHFVQPVNNDVEVTKKCINFVKDNSNWQLSMQLHKLVNIR